MTVPATSQWWQLDQDNASPVLSLSGHWRITSMNAIQASFSTLDCGAAPRLDGSSLGSIDSAGALQLLLAMQSRGTDLQALELAGFAPDHQRILNGVRERLLEQQKSTPHPRSSWLARQLAGLGRSVVATGELLHGHLNFLGATISGFLQLLLHPTRLRYRELTVQFEQICLTALPVVALVTMLIGVTVAYLLGLQAEKYGANIFVIDGVGIGMTREFSPIIVATIIAGRSGAAFTAHLGAMRLTEEIDAIRTLGLSPMQVLVIPRVLALVLALPLLVFVGDVMGILGAMLVADPLLGLTPATVLNRLQTSLDLTHFWVGFAKAPAFALFIAIIGCRMGMTVSRDTRAVGMATTSTVVQGIVSVILLDAAFAIVLQSIGV
jgi:phospholipid/cholesterol/gamma-HCH transport system permease protein